MASLDTLSTFRSELTAGQLDHAAGGLVHILIIVGLAAFDIVLWDHILSQ